MSQSLKLKQLSSEQIQTQIYLYNLNMIIIFLNNFHMSPKSKVLKGL